MNKWYNVRLDRLDMIGGITVDGTPLARNLDIVILVLYCVMLDRWIDEKTI